jgi:hypothetical protein
LEIPFGIIETKKHYTHMVKLTMKHVVSRSVGGWVIPHFKVCNMVDLRTKDPLLVVRKVTAHHP